MAALIDAAQLAAITTVAQARAWAGLSPEPWEALSASLGTVPTLQVLAYIPIFGFKEAIEDARVPVPAQGVPGEDGHVPATTRQLTMVEGTQAGLMLQLARLKFDREVVDPLAASATPATPGSQAAPGTTVPGTGGQSQSLHRKIKNSQVIDQADEGEIPTLDHATLDEHYKVLREAKGGPVRPETEPSADQIAAMKARGRFSKALKFLNHVLQPDGTFKAVEVSGPPNFDAWTLSWKVYVNTLLTLEVVVGTKKVSIASLSAMEEYHDMFRDLVKNYPEAWHLLVIAEDRCRGEHFPGVRRELEAQHDRGLAPNFEPKRPWDEVFRTAARDRDYWDRHVREPALLFRTAGKHKEQVGGTGAATDLTNDKPTGRTKPKKSQKERLKAQLAKLREDRREDSNPPSGNTGRGKGSGKGKDRGSKRDGQGRFARVDQPPQPGQERGKGGSPVDREVTADRTLMELFAGFGGLTQAVRDLGLPVKEPQDTRFGHDIASDEGFLAVLEAKADWKHMALPCRTFTKARRQDAHGRTKRLRTEGHPEGYGDPEAEEANLLADRCAAIGEEQDEREDFFSIENPLDSFIWDLKSMKRLARRKGVQLTPLDQCAYGGPHQKATGILHNTAWLAQGLRCGDVPPHQHSKLAGKVWSYKEGKEVWYTSEAAEYPSGLCEAWATGWLRWLQSQPDGGKDTYVKLGVFPWSDTTKAQEASAEYLAALGDYGRIDRNYTSFHENEQDSKEELDRWPKARATKLATLVKTRPDGTNKVRFIADMRRSGVNGMTFAEERIVLPRGTDFTKDILDLLELGQAEVELYSADFTDAFLNLPIDPAERQLQIYVDDPAGVVAGSSAERDRIISKTLALWSALGARIALHKACRGKCIKWIGANYTILHRGVRLSIDAERIKKLTETVDKALAHRGLVPGVRSLAGELSWIAGLVPTIRPFVNMVCAALYGMDNQRNKARTGQSAARARPVGTVFAKAIRLPMIWMKRNGGTRPVVGWAAAPNNPPRTRSTCGRCRLGLLVQLDSESALRVAVKLASPHPVVNRLAAEMALRLESLNAEALTGQHWRNVINLEADALSRLTEGKEVPARLRCLPRDQAVPLRLHTRVPRLSLWEGPEGGPARRIDPTGRCRDGCDRTTSRKSIGPWGYLTQDRTALGMWELSRLLTHRAVGSGLHGAGKLPPKPAPKAKSETGGRRRLPQARRDAHQDRAALPAEPGSTGDRPAEPARPDPVAPDRSPRRERTEGGDRRGKEREEGRRRDENRRERREEEENRPRDTGRREGRRSRERTPRREERRRHRRHPTERTYRSDSSEESGPSEEEEEVLEEEMADYDRDPSPRRDEHSPARDTAADKAEAWPAPANWWCNVGCGRYCRTKVDTCCGACEDTAGMEHTRDCDRRNGYNPPPPGQHWDPPGKGGGDNRPGKDKGGGWGKGHSTKKASKIRRGYDRSVRRRQEGKTWGRPFPMADFTRALAMGRAASTVKSWRARWKRGEPPSTKGTRAPMPRPDHPQHGLLAVGVWYLLRVSELIALSLGDVAIRQNATGWTAALTIRTSKTDQEARSETIARDCVCLTETSEEARTLCPAHILWTQVGQRLGELRALGCTGSQAPLFVTEDGEKLTERYVMTAVERSAQAAGEPLKENGQARFGTHSLRVAGAVLAFQAGLSESVVRSLGRWRSERAMLAYLRGTPLVKASGSSGKMLTAMIDSGGCPLRNTNFRPLVQEGRLAWKVGTEMAITGPDDRELEDVEDGPHDQEQPHRSGAPTRDHEGTSTGMEHSMRLEVVRPRSRHVAAAARVEISYPAQYGALDHADPSGGGFTSRLYRNGHRWQGDLCREQRLPALVLVLIAPAIAKAMQAVMDQRGRRASERRHENSISMAWIFPYLVTNAAGDKPDSGLGTSQSRARLPHAFEARVTRIMMLETAIDLAVR
eukprot:s3999_g4.t1